MKVSRRVFVTASAAALAQTVPASASVLGGSAASTVILVRHGEKSAGDGDVPLSAAGQERAEALARTLSDARVSAIFTSRAKRTQDTARPLAKLLQVASQTLEKGKIDEVSRQLQGLGAGSVAVLVWHVDELPQIVEKLGAKLPNYGDQEYDRLVMLTLLNGKAVSMVTLRYGR